MKLKKTFTALLLALTAVTAGTLFTACDDNNADGPGEKPDKPSGGGISTYTIEAEYVDLENVTGSGLSSDQSGVEMIYGDGTDAQKALGWSGGYYVGYTYTAECEIEFIFNSDKETTGTVVIRLGSEIGDIMLTPSALALTLNGSALNYGSLSVQNSPSMAEMKFKDYTVGVNAKILKGENKLVFSVKSNKLRGSQTGGPTVDCVKITTDANITYDAKTGNPGLRGAI